MKKISWGILSTAKIGRKKVIPAMQKGIYTSIDAIASRSIDSASQTAQKLGIPKAYGSYEDLLADKHIEAIYIPLPNHLHVEWTIKCLQAGKHVLCEKPIAVNATDAARLLEETKKFPDLKVMEAFMYRLHPQWQKAKQLVEQEAIGKLVSIQSTFAYSNTDPSNVRNQADIGGGGLLDIGCYCISLSRWIVGKEPERVMGSVKYDPVFKTDRLAAGILDFGEVAASFICSTQMSPYQRVQIFGDNGHIEIEIPFNAPPDQACKLWLYGPEGSKEISFEAVDQYTLQGDQFSQAILNDTPVPTSLEDAVANMKVIDALLKYNNEPPN